MIEKYKQKIVELEQHIKELKVIKRVNIYQYHKGLYDCHYVFRLFISGTIFSTDVFEFEELAEVQDFIENNISCDWDINETTTYVKEK